MKRILGIIPTIAIILSVYPAVALAVDFTFAGDVYCTTGKPIEDAVALVRYVYTFEGQLPREGRAYVDTDANGLFTLVRDISGPGILESVIAWAWVGGIEKFIPECTASQTNYFGYWKFDCSGPAIWFEDPPLPDVPGKSASIGIDGQYPECSTWGELKSLFR